MYDLGHKKRQEEVFVERLICLNENFTSLHWTLRFNFSIILYECLLCLFVV
jgi:hypothetical protein